MVGELRGARLVGKLAVKAMESKTDRSINQRLTRFGSFVWKTVKNSIVKTKKSSDPGKPPRSHAPHSFYKAIRFQAEPELKNVTIGVMKSGKGIAEIIEYGGSSTVTVTEKTAKGSPSPGKRRTVRAQYAARPFLRPAFASELKKNGEKILKDLYRGPL